MSLARPEVPARLDKRTGKRVLCASTSCAADIAYVTEECVPVRLREPDRREWEWEDQRWVSFGPGWTHVAADDAWRMTAHAKARVGRGEEPFSQGRCPSGKEVATAARMDRSSPK